MQSFEATPKHAAFHRLQYHYKHAVLGLILFAVGRSAIAQTDKPIYAPDTPQTSSPRYIVNGQSTFVVQNIPRFSSPYSGPNSLVSRHETEISHTYTLFLGAKLSPNLEAYVDPEIAAGSGLSEGVGLAGFSNGELIGQPTLRQEPYLARFFLRWRVPTGKGSEQEVQVGRSQNLFGGQIPSERLVFTFGKLSVTDHFDLSSYANNPRTQFLNTALGNNAAYDVPKDARGYSVGAYAAWVHPSRALRIASFQMPTGAGSADLDGDLLNSRGDQIEWELHPRLLRTAHKPPAIVRLLGFRNIANRGRYRDALGVSGPSAPDLSAVRKSGVVKYGYGFNIEQALADGGVTGVFARWGWNDGATESTSSECDRAFSLGGQMAGTRWRRPSDRIGLAFAQNELSAAHKDYLSAGGIGLAVGDGRLNYGAERILESYYSFQVSKPVSISLDYQHIDAPGYNRDRGAVDVFSLRLHAEF